MTTATLQRPKTKKKIKLIPLSDRVVLQRDEAQERTKGDIVLPDKAKDKVNRGRVIAVGDGRMDDEGRRIPMSVKAGDHVLFTKYGGDEFKFDDEEYLLIRESDILAMLDE